MRLVIDTNVLISYLFWPDSPFYPLVDDLLQRNDILRSTQTFAELSEVVLRPKFDRYSTIVERELFLAEFYDNSKQVLVTERITACRDPKDDKFLELAVCGKADCIVSGDEDLVALDGFWGIRIVSPKGF